MRRTVLLSILLAGTAIVPMGAQSAPDTAATTFMVGPMRVIHQQRTVSQTVSVRLFLLGGARQVDARTAGVEPLLLRAASMGSSKYPGTASQRAMARVGASTYIEVTDD